MKLDKVWWSFEWKIESQGLLGTSLWCGSEGIRPNGLFIYAWDPSYLLRVNDSAFARGNYVVQPGTGNWLAVVWDIGGRMSRELGRSWLSTGRVTEVGITKNRKHAGQMAAGRSIYIMRRSVTLGHHVYWTSGRAVLPIGAWGRISLHVTWILLKEFI